MRSLIMADSFFICFSVDCEQLDIKCVDETFTSASFVRDLTLVSSTCSCSWDVGSTATRYIHPIYIDSVYYPIM